MPVSHKLKTIFIHIPKNAGESVEKTLGMYGGNPKDSLWGVINNRIVLQHLTANRIKTEGLICEKNWHEYFKFAIVRNPWSKAVSEYNWYLKFGPAIDFNEWVMSLEHRIKINSAIHLWEIGHNIEQHKFVFSQAGELLVDKLLKFEDLKYEFNLLSGKKGWELPLSHEKTTKSLNNIPFHDYYDELSAVRISQIYAKDIERFGYSIEDTFSATQFRKEPFKLNETSANRTKNRFYKAIFREIPSIKYKYKYYWYKFVSKITKIRKTVGK